MPMTDQEVTDLKQQYSDLLQGMTAQRNAAMDEQVNLGAVIRATARERDALKTEVTQLKDQLAKLMAPPAETAPAALAAAAPALANGAATPAA